MTEADSDLDLLQGEWAITALRYDGEDVPPHTFAAARLVVEGDRFTSLGMGSAYSGKITLNTSVSPRAFDMFFEDGVEKGNTNYGIYEFTGDDRWRLCLATRGAERPKTFASTASSGIALETLERDHNSTE
jgi:uncharacterized protein (TIGR03067 family)